MDFIDELQELALASRLRRLGDMLAMDIASIYDSQQYPFDPKWFPYFHLIQRHGPLSVADIGKLLNVVHPTVIKITNEMLAAGLILSDMDTKDKRKRMMALSPQGQELSNTMQPLWEHIRNAMKVLIKDSGYDVLDVLLQMEKAIDRHSIRGRVLAEQEKN